LEAFADREGNVKFQRDYKTANGYRLGGWVSDQRKAKSSLSPERKARLEALPGWNWDPIADLREKGFRHLKEFEDQEGHTKVPQGYKAADGYRLGLWVNNQRAKADRLTQDRREQLETLSGWSWDPIAEQWEEGFRYLKEFADREGYAKVPSDHKTANGYRLGKWVAERRKNKDILSPERKVRLEALPGLSWDTHADSWEKGVRYFMEFVKREGHAKVPKQHRAADGYGRLWPICSRATSPSLRGKLPCGMHDVQHDDRVLRQLHEHDIRQAIDDQLACTGNTVALPDTLRERGQTLDLLDDASLDRFGCARTRLSIVVSDYFREVVKRLFGPEDPHPLLGLARQFRFDA
jgi:hypothetical protein